MPATIAIHLEPAGRTLILEEGDGLRDALFAQGVEFPCGGRGRCRGCRVRVRAGHAPVTAEDLALFDPAELAAGWRLACRLTASPGLTLELAQWEALILDDDTRFEFTPRDGLGIAVDVGTTTVVAQLVDLQTAHVLGVQTGLNEQARHGADLMTRLDFATREDGLKRLRNLIRDQVGAMIRALLLEREFASPRPVSEVREVLLVGNTLMHHLFAGLPVDGLGHHPYHPADPEAQAFEPLELGWESCLPMIGTRITFLPCLGSFVGSDILAGILATRLQASPVPAALVDLGTNGEIVVGSRDGMVCASTAAGPAFEGARIAMGMRAATGAISEVEAVDGDLRCHVLGNGRPRGICGSGLVDAVAAGLELGLVEPSGRLPNGQAIRLEPPVELGQRDIRELQLAKGAITTGIRLLARQSGITLTDLTAVHLAGAFGNYINRASARRIGLLPFPPDRVRPAGNTALLGAKMALFRDPQTDLSFRDLRAKVRHVALSEDPAFLDTYTEEMRFPAPVNE